MFSEKLKSIRKERGMTQIQLAQALNVSNGTVAMWETNERKPNIIMLKKLAKVLGCTTDELLEQINV